MPNRVTVPKNAKNPMSQESWTPTSTESWTPAPKSPGTFGFFEFVGTVTQFGTCLIENIEEFGTAVQFGSI